jgi:16S rRNA (cytidine1402-2'-O)-methyltransferase
VGQGAYCPASKSQGVEGSPLSYILSDDRLLSMRPHDQNSTPLAPGLYVVATPIGNLEDITLRALRILKQADLIACEDTRQTQKLLTHFGITTRTTSYHEHNEASRAEELVGQLAKGARIALVTDAGMPGISDPGYRVIAKAVERQIPVIPIPGASAFVAALAVSGLPTDPVEFHGFLPPKRGQRRQVLEGIKNSQQTQVFYEAPHRMQQATEDVVEILGADRQIVIAREITKTHEEFLRGPAGEILKQLSTRAEIKGEITLLIGKAERGEATSSVASISQLVQQAMTAEGLDEKAALKRVAKNKGISKSEAYRELQRNK